MAVLTVQTIVYTGIVPTYASAAAGGDEFANNGRIFLHVKNGDASPINVTITTTGTMAGRAVADDVIAVAATGEKMIGPFPTALYNAADGNVDVAYSAVTSVTVAAIKLP